jgi:hypothetical protein
MKRKHNMPKPKTQKSYGKIVGFRPSKQLAPMILRLEGLPHVHKSWVYNRAMLAGLPSVLREIGA